MGVKVRDAATDLVRKADLALAELTSDGGVLLPGQAKKFIRKLMKQSVIMKSARVIPMVRPKERIEKIGLTSRILHAGTSGSALASGDRSKPALFKQELSTKLMKAEIDIPDEVFEDNIEGNSLKDTLLGLMVERAALDLDELFLLGDTTLVGSDAFLGLLDGFLKSATSNVFDADGEVVSKNTWKAMWKTMPQEYRQIKSAMRIYTSSDAQTEYSDQIGERGTSAGDKAAIDGMAPKWQGIPIEEIPVMPQDLGEGEDETAALLLNPKNMVVGVQRRIRVRTDVDVRAGVIWMVLDLRMDAQYEEEEAVVKATGMLFE